MWGQITCLEFQMHQWKPSLLMKNFPDEHIFVMCKEPWYADITNYLANRRTPSS